MLTSCGGPFSGHLPDVSGLLPVAAPDEQRRGTAPAAGDLRGVRGWRAGRGGRDIPECTGTGSDASAVPPFSQSARDLPAAGSRSVKWYLTLGFCGPAFAHVISMSTGQATVAGNRVGYILRMPDYEIGATKNPA